MDDLDPRKLDWPLPPAAEEEEASSGDEALQVAAEEIRHALRGAPSSLSADFLDTVARIFGESPAPAQSVSALHRLLHGNRETADFFLQLALANPERFRRLFVLCGHSAPLASWLASGGWRRWMEAEESELRRAVTSETVAEGARRRIAAGEDPPAALRRNHREMTMRVLAHEVLDHAPLETVGAEISALAEGAIEAALELAVESLYQRRGWVAAEDFRFCVLGFGKLGACELNYSSDIDLAFLYEGSAPLAERGRPPTAQEYAVRLAEMLIPLLSDQNEHGHVFRVDTRLRPEGKRGRLARSLESTVSYYHGFGVTLERQALIKARPVGGDLALGHQLVERLQGWVFRKYLSVAQINEIKDLKRRIEHRTDLADQTFRDVKHGFGGIRDIEFVVQFLQLLNGGRHPGLRVRDTLSALRALAAHGVLKPSEAGELAEAYRFLRSLEHRLQLREGAQTHLLPDRRPELEQTARAMGASGQNDPASVLIHRLQAHSLKVRGLLVRLFSGLFAAQGGAAECDLVLDPEPDAEQARTLLSGYGFRDPEGALRLIQALAEETPENRFYAPRTRKYLASMMPALLEFAGSSPDPDFTLRNFEHITTGLGAKTMLFELAAEDPHALAIFGGIAAHSRWLSEILVRRPGLVDEFADELQTFSRTDRQALEHDLKSRLAAAEDLLDALYWHRDVELLRIGVFDLLGRTPLPETLRELATLAEVALTAALDHVLARESARTQSLQGDPRDHLAVAAMGKLGARALNYASDLDLVLVYEPGAFAEGDGTAAQTFYSAVARGLVDLLATPRERGLLWKIDLRLRPRGRSGALAVSIDKLREYVSPQTGEALFWERLASCRARVLDNVGAAAAPRVTKIFHDFVYEAPLEDAAARTREMRERIEKQASAGDLKKGRGGLLDIEFLVGFLQLEHGPRIPALRTADFFEAFHLLPAEGLLDQRTHDALADAYAFLRQASNRLQLLDGRSVDALPEGDELETFARRMGFSAGGGLTAAEQLLEELEWHRHHARRAFTRYVK